ncbi:cupin domain-containing protein [Microbacterium sp.]|uniref:cupin domain-containing protein n=1 Tax=Microbacterium sp. TaxID=51671 RepID=UPI0039E2EB7E
MSTYDVLELGSIDSWGQADGVAPGKRFAEAALPLQYLGLSANSLDPGGSAPFWHRHATHEEIYLFLTGTGQMALDDDVVDVGPGTLVRVGQDTWRAWHAAADSDGPLTWICVRAGGGTLEQIGRDGERDTRPFPW